MRLVCYLNSQDLNNLRKGAPISVSLVGMSALAIHFDPDEEEAQEREPVSVPQPKRKDKDDQFPCDHCGRVFRRARALGLHKNWIKRLSEQNGKQEESV
jgi:hypothetical protein